jgi:hypothetical protein
VSEREPTRTSIDIGAAANISPATVRHLAIVLAKQLTKEDIERLKKI